MSPEDIPTMPPPLKPRYVCERCGAESDEPGKHRCKVDSFIWVALVLTFIVGPAIFLFGPMNTTSNSGTVVLTKAMENTDGVFDPLNDPGNPRYGSADEADAGLKLPEVRAEVRKRLELEVASMTTLLEESVQGVIEPSAIILQALSLIGDEVGPVDLDYEDFDSTAFSIFMSEGMKATLLVGHNKFDRAGHELREYCVRLEIPQKQPWISNGAVREGYRVDIGVSRDAEGKAWRYSLLTNSKVSLGASRNMGLDAYHGRFTEGIHWIYYPEGIAPTFCRTTGIQDGNYVQSKDFDPVLPQVTGEPSKEILDALNQKISNLLKGTQK